MSPDLLNFMAQVVLGIFQHDDLPGRTRCENSTHLLEFVIKMIDNVQMNIGLNMKMICSEEIVLALLVS